MKRWKLVLGCCASVIASGLVYAAWLLLPSSLHLTDSEPVELFAGSLQVDGLTREFYYYRPQGLKSDAPLVFVLHGSKSTALGMRAITAYGFERIASAEGAIVVYPQGFEKHWNDCRTGADYAANTRNIADPEFFAAMIDWFASEFAADRTRVMVTGYSNGGHMAYRLALEHPELVLAIAPIAASLPAPGNNDCAASGQAVAVAIVNGTDDPVNPFAGGVVSIFGNTSRGEVLSSAATARYWAGLLKSSELVIEALPDTDPEDGTRIHLEQWPQPGQEVLHVIVEGGGHNIPTPGYRQARLFGPTSHDIDAPELLWQFFKRQWTSPKPALADPSEP